MMMPYQQILKLYCLKLLKQLANEETGEGWLEINLELANWFIEQNFISLKISTLTVL